MAKNESPSQSKLVLSGLPREDRAPRPGTGRVCNTPADRLARLIYTGLGLGLAPKAPGTFGTLLGLPLFWLMKDLAWPGYLAVTAAVTLLGLWAAGRAERHLARHDAPQVVVDEVAGYLVTMFLAPPHFWAMAGGLVLFRFFDILKPWPVSWADRRVPGALGVMLDDLLAGAYAWLALRLLILAVERA